MKKRLGALARAHFKINQEEQQLPLIRSKTIYRSLRYSQNNCITKRWALARGSYQATRGSYQATRDSYQATRGSYQATRGSYQATRDSYQATRDSYQATRGTYQATRE